MGKSWGDLFGRSRRRERARVTFPVHVDLDDPRLRITIHAHDLQTADTTIGCWSYVTNGLAFWGQKEIIVTIKREPHESPDDYPDDPIGYLAAVATYAKQGRLVDAGDVTHSGPTPVLFGGQILYIDAQPVPGVDLPSPALAAIVITCDELNALQRYGPTRVMARLGREAGYFPCPPWSDRQRVRSAAPIGGKSILDGVGVARVPGVTVMYDGRNVRLSATPRGRVALREAMTSWSVEQPGALLTDIGAANGCLVWRPGFTGLNAIAPPNSKGDQVAACFVLIAGSQPANELRLIEDGVGLILTDESTSALRNALMNGHELRLMTSSGSAITVDGADTADEGIQVFLMHSGEQLQARGLAAEALTPYLKNLMEVIKGARRENRLPAAFAVFVTLRGTASRAWNAPPELRQALEAIASPPVDAGPAAFVLCCRPGGEHQPFDPMRDLPEEWMAAINAAGAAAPGQALSVDEVIALAWPAH